MPPPYVRGSNADDAMTDKVYSVHMWPSWLTVSTPKLACFRIGCWVSGDFCDLVLILVLELFVLFHQECDLCFVITGATILEVPCKQRVFYSAQA